MRIIFCFVMLLATSLAAEEIVLVTGGAQGIGRAIAERFATEGAKVIIADIQEASFDHPSVEWLRCDVASEEEVSRLFDHIEQNYHSLSGVVQNAAIAVYHLIEDYTLLEWDRVQAVNLRGVFLIARKALPLMKKRRAGWMVLISSVHGHVTSTCNSSYVATKGGILALTRALALEAAPYGVRINAVSPGAIDTPMLMENWGDLSPENHPLVPRIPLKRIGRPDEIADAVHFLSSNQASYITGSELLVDGGLSAHFD